MAFLDEMYSGLMLNTGRIPKGLEMRLLQGPAVEPVTVDEFKAHMRIPLAVTSMDTTIARILKSCRKSLEAFTHRCFISQQWEQSQNVVGRQIELYRKPVLSVDAIEYIANFDTDNRQTFSSSLYVTSGVDSNSPGNGPGYVLARSTWPVHRGWKSFFITMTCGYGDAADAVPDNIKEAILMWAGHSYENPEGEGSGLTLSSRGMETDRIIPSDVMAKLEEYIDWRI